MSELTDTEVTLNFQEELIHMCTWWLCSQNEDVWMCGSELSDLLRKYRVIEE